MRIILFKTTRPRWGEIRTLVEEYEKRLRPFMTIQKIEAKEGVLPPEGFLVLLDERGKGWSSKEVAERLRGWSEDPAIKTLVFWIGGPFGFTDEARKRANALWSLSPATLQGDIAWLVAWEQIYRAFTLWRGIPYHHE